MQAANVAPTSARAAKRMGKHVEGDVKPPLAATTVENGAGACETDEEERHVPPGIWPRTWRLT